MLKEGKPLLLVGGCFLIFIGVRMIRHRHPHIDPDNAVTANVFTPASPRAIRDDGERNLTAVRPPNIVFILADDVSACELSPYGGAIRMPNLQKLADDGVLFRNAWSTPVCAPSRAMMMTGKYPHHTGYYENPVHPEVPFWEDPRHLPILKMMLN